MSMAKEIYEATCRSEEAPWAVVQDMEEIPAEAVGNDPGGADDYHLRAWAFFYGAAYAAVRLEQPLGSEEGWQAAARDAATKVCRWHTTVGGRPEGES
jgi:hypothetical protein